MSFTPIVPSHNSYSPSTTVVPQQKSLVSASAQNYLSVPEEKGMIARRTVLQLNEQNLRSRILNFVGTPNAFAVCKVCKAWNSNPTKLYIEQELRQAVQTLLSQEVKIPLNSLFSTVREYRKIHCTSPEENIRYRLAGIHSPVAIFFDLNSTESKTTILQLERQTGKSSFAIATEPITWAKYMIKTVLFLGKRNWSVYDDKRFDHFSADIYKESITVTNLILDACDQLTAQIVVDNKTEPKVYQNIELVLSFRFPKPKFLDKIFSTYALLHYLHFYLRQNISSKREEYRETLNRIVRHYKNDTSKKDLQEILDAFLSLARTEEVQRHMEKCKHLKAYKNNLEKIQEVRDSHCLAGANNSEVCVVM